ncbi:MAG: hypothetical protein ACRERC_20315 [Candidatus Binatia bacterium]
MVPPSRFQLALLTDTVRERLFLLDQRRRLRRIAAYHRPPADVGALLEAVQRKVLVFTVTAGRSGTTFLARLFAALPDVASLHEPAPHFQFFMRQAQHDPAAARRFWLEYKLPQIAAEPTARYAELSHMFGKGFLEPLLALGIVPRVVMLRRHPRLVAASWQARGATPGRGKRGLKLHLRPDDPDVLPYPNWHAATDYQLCFWYALEIERRQRVYQTLLERAGGITVDVTADELHDGDRFLAAADTLDLLAPGVDRIALLRRHCEIAAVIHKPSTRRIAPAPIDEETQVWAAVSAAAPWLRAEVDQRYPPPR